MKRGRTRQEITDKEEEILRMFWEHGPLRVRELVELYPEPKPHFNTVSTFVRSLERKGLVSHDETSSAFKYYAVAKMEDFRRKSLGELIKNYFSNSYLGAVSSLIEEEKISPEELSELIESVKKRNS